MTSFDPAAELARLRALPAPQRDAEILARTLWGEARGEIAREGERALEAVGFVIRRRAMIARRRHGWAIFGDGTIAGACLFPRQFSCWNEGDPNRVKMLREAPADQITFPVCRAVARRIVRLDDPALAPDAPSDPTGGADHYYSWRVMRTAPPWARGQKPTARIGSHDFFRLA